MVKRFFQAVPVDPTDGTGGDGGEEDGGDGGGVPDFHGAPLTVSWLLLIDIAVLVAAVRWRKYSFYIHLFLALLVTGLTLGATIPILMDEWIDGEEDQKILEVHKIAGFVVVVWLGLQAVTGIFARLIQYSEKVPTMVCIWVKRAHYISSYLLMLLAKFNYLNIKWIDGELESSFILLIIADIVFIAIYLWIKFAYWTLSEETTDHQVTVSSVKSSETTSNQIIVTARNSAQSLRRQLTLDSLFVPKINESLIKYQTEAQITLEKYVIFNDFVYDTEPLKQLHPGGQYIIKITNKREIDRFLYGCYTAELTPNAKIHSHSQGCLNLCGPPVAKMSRTSPMKGLKDFNKMNLVKTQEISSQNTIFLLNLKPIDETILKFTGFQSESQIGQYFSLTISKANGRARCTRLYTTIWCARPQNLKFMEKCFPMSSKFGGQKTEMKQILKSSSVLYGEDQTIPLVIKKYKKGQLTPRLLVEQFQGQILLSKPMGRGMDYGNLPESGKIIIVCGGTGILPFCDLIDLLFKRLMILEQNILSQTIQKKDSLVSQDLFKKRQFILYFSAQSSYDILPLTAFQINKLCGSEKIYFSSVFRIKKGENEFIRRYQNISTQKDYFNKNVTDHIKQQGIGKIYVCGSPQMNGSIAKIFESENVGNDCYHFM